MKFEVAATVEYKPDLLSEGIMKKLGTNYSHIIIIVDNMWVYQASGKRVNRVLLSDFLQARRIVVRKDITDLIKKHHEYALGWLDGNIGKEYSSSQYIGFLFKRLAKFVANGNEKTVCSEFAASFTVVTGVFSEITFHAIDLVDPKTFIDAIETL